MNLIARVDKLESHMRVTLAGRARVDVASMPDPRTLGLLDWCKLILPEHCGLDWNPIHRQIAADADHFTKARGARCGYIGPRDTGKSVVLSLGLILRSAVEGTEPYILIGSETGELVEKLFEPIKEELEANERLAAFYPEAVGKGPVWRDNRVRLRNGVAIEAISTGKTMRGSRNKDKRPTLIVLDDIQGDKHMWSPRLREKTLAWFNGELMKIGAPDCNVYVAGNGIHREVVVCKLIGRPTWKAERFSSLMAWPKRMDLWAEWEAILTNGANPNREAEAEAFFLRNLSAMVDGAELLWPARHSLYGLMSERAAEGHVAFMRERQSQPVSVESVEWPEATFEGDELWFDEMPITIARVAYIDPSMGNDARTGDFSAIVTVGFGADGLVYVDADLERRPVDKLARDAASIFVANRIEVLGVESVGFQQLVGSEINRVAQSLGLLLPVLSMPADGPKPVRIRRLSPYLSLRKFRFRRSRGTRLLFDQLREFPGGNHDDGPDALEGAMRMLNAKLKGRAE